MSCIVGFGLGANSAKYEPQSLDATMQGMNPWTLGPAVQGKNPVGVDMLENAKTEFFDEIGNGSTTLKGPVLGNGTTTLEGWGGFCVGFLYIFGLGSGGQEGRETSFGKFPKQVPEPKNGHSR